MSEGKKQYKPPRIIDLTGAHAEGQVEGFCQPGTSPHDPAYDCETGFAPVNAAICTVVGNAATGVCDFTGGAAGGGGFNPCDPFGSNAGNNKCVTGGLVVYGCDPGSYPT